MKCAHCKGPATKKVIWADGRAYQPSCDKHVRDVQHALTVKNGKMTELAGVQDLANVFVKGRTIDLVSSAVYPGLERKPGGPDNWVERAGGLPKYIERIAKHLHYEKGFSISRAIATAVNTVKRWARMGRVAKYGDPNKKHVTAKTAALAAAAVASWEAKKKAGKINLSDVGWYIIDMTEVTDEFALDLAEELEEVYLEGYDFMGAGADEGTHAILRAMDLTALAKRANKIEDPEAKAKARQQVLDLAVPRRELTAEKRRERASEGQAMPDGSFPIFDKTSLQSAIRLARTPQQRAHVMRRARALGLTDMIPDQWTTDLTNTILEANTIDLASTIPPRNARGRATDGRKSFKGQGRWKHGHIPLNRAAKEAKAKGSPIAMKRMNRLFGGDRVADEARKSARGPKRIAPHRATGRTGQRTLGGQVKRNTRNIKVAEKSNPTAERANDIAFLRHQKSNEATKPLDSKLPETSKEANKVGRVPARATQNWNEIPENLKTVRNGKRYVYAEFGGAGYVTPWVGGVHTTDTSSQKKMTSITAADAARMPPAQIAAMLADPAIPRSVKKVLRRVSKVGRR